MNLSIRITRKPASWNYRHTGPDSWHSQDANNSLDTFALYDGNKAVFSSNCQTVSNTEGLLADAKESDTIMPGSFFIKAFVEKRNFACDPHGIVGATTKHGDAINSESVTIKNPYRWLVHDWRNSAGNDTRVAWSSGCIVLPTKNLERFNMILRSYDVRPGDLIPAALFDEGES